MVTGQVKWNHANVKTTVKYWYDLMYHSVVELGVSFTEAKKLYPRPTIQARKDAYDEALEKLLVERSYYLQDQQLLKNQDLGDKGLWQDPNGNIFDLYTGKMVSQRYVPEDEENNTMLYVLIGVAVLLLFMIMKKKK